MKKHAPTVFHMPATWTLALALLAVAMSPIPICAQENNVTPPTAHFLNPIDGSAGDAHSHWEHGGARAGYEQTADGHWALFLDSTPTPGRGWYIWKTTMAGILPNTDYRVSFDRMYDTLTDQGGVTRCHIFGRELPVPNSDQPRIWDRYSIQVNSGALAGDIPFDIVHYHDSKKVWYRNFQIVAVEATALAPIDGHEVAESNPVLRWQAPADASFALQLSSSPDFPAAQTHRVGPLLDTDHWRVDPPLEPGSWYWRVAIASAALVNPDTARYGSSEHFVVPEGAAAVPVEVPEPIVPVDAPHRVTISPEGKLLIDGVPRFLIGLYAVMEERTDLEENSYMTDANVASCAPLFRELAEAGFNTIQNYGTASGRDKQVNAYLDLADQHGLWVLVQMTGVEGLHKTAVEAQMRSFTRHPSVIGWLLKDEGDMSGWSPVKARVMYDWMRAIDPARPVAMVVRDSANYINAVDLLLPDPYTLRTPLKPQHALGEILHKNQEDARAALTPTTAASVLQAFKYEDEFDKENRADGRVPSYEEERCIAYLSIAAGQQGVLFYAYHSSATYLKEYPEHWANLKRIAGELRDRSPIFLAPEGPAIGTVSGEGILHFTREYDGATYLFLINPDLKEQAVHIAWNSSVSTAHSLEEDRPVTMEEDFQTTLPAFAVRTYRLTVDAK